MTDFLSFSEKGSLLISLYQKVKINPECFLDFCTAPLRVQMLLKERGTLGAGGEISFVSLPQGELMLRIRSESYRLAHECAARIKAILLSPDSRGDGPH